jgi:CRISPR-associated protein Csd1
MILKALYDLAVREDLIPDPDFEVRSISWVVRVDSKGRGQVIALPESTYKRVPKFATSKSGTNPPADFLVGNPLYVFGVSVPQDKYDKRTRKKRALLFTRQVIRCGVKTDDIAVKSVVCFLKDLYRGVVQLDVPIAMKSNDLIAFSYQTEELLVHERSAVSEYWRSLRAEQQKEQESICLVSGEKCAPAKKHKKLKNVPQKKMSDIALAPCNQNAFESYGWEKGENALIGENESDMAMTALNRLLHPNPPDPHDPNQTLSRQNVKLSSDTVVCYWTKNQNELSDSFGLAIEVDPEKIDAKPEQIREMYKSLWRGVPYKLGRPDEFYSLVLSGGQGRATVRDWIESNTQYVADSLAQYFADLRIVRCCPVRKGEVPPESFALSELLEALADPKEKRKEGIPAAIGAQFYRASIDQKRIFPQPAFHRAILRYRAELGKESDNWNAKKWNDARAAIIKAYLNRKWRKESKYEEVNEAMNPNCTDKGYLLGQLLAVLEKLQQTALGEGVNATIVDRYFSGASTSPKSVFGSLLRNARHHVRKAKDDPAKRGAVHSYENLVDQLCSQFDVMLQNTADPHSVYRNGFPPTLSQDEQGMFVLGYHQMRKWLWMDRSERDLWNAEHADAPKAYIWKKKNADDIVNETEVKGEE